MRTTASIENHRVVSTEQWLAARKKLLAREKELARLEEPVAHERRALPWLCVEKGYVFDTPEGRRTLADLFEGRPQLLVKYCDPKPTQCAILRTSQASRNGNPGSSFSIVIGKSRTRTPVAL